MNKPSPAPEPTMEEILASIRRIISDGDEMAGAEPAHAVSAQAAGRAESVSDEDDLDDDADDLPNRDFDNIDAGARSAEAGSAEAADVFDLTDDMVADDDEADDETVEMNGASVEDAIEAAFGTGPSAATRSAATPPASTPPASPAPARASSAAAPGGALAAGLVDPDRMDVAFGGDEDADASVSGGFDSPAAKPERPDMTQAKSTTVPPRPAANAATPQARATVPPSAPTPAAAGQTASGSAARGTSDRDPHLLSPKADTLVTAAFGRLADTMLSRDPRTLEDLVKEMLRPILKEWLDDNLPALVEQMVREEIERVSRGRR